MAPTQTRFLRGLEELRPLAAQWNDLWHRSDARQPTAMWEGLESWIAAFGTAEEAHAVVVEQDGRLLAAMPLIRSYTGGVLPTYRLPVNCWANSSDLMLDPAEDTEALLDALVACLEESQVALLSLDEVLIDAPHWAALRVAIERRRGECFVARQSPVGVVDVLHDWQRYEESWSGNHRGAIRRSRKKLEKQGELRAELHRCRQGAELDSLMRAAFAIEDRSWKGAAGSSVLKTPGMFAYMLREAETVSQLGCLDFWFLYFNDQPIAFEYCHFAKGICFSHKIGFEPEYSRHGPGRLLRYLQLEHYHSDNECQLFDMLGTLCESKAKWATRTYQVGRMHMSIGSRLSGLMLRSLAWARPRWRQLRGREASPQLKLGAAGLLEGDHQLAT